VKRRHHDLLVWQQAVALVTDIYNITKAFPKEEIYGLTNQMRRAAVSVPCNIAEGAARTSPKEMLQFLSIARGSLSELETQVIIAKELGYIKASDELNSAMESVFALLGGLVHSIRRKE
jgi:four helix bundle protein